MLVNGSLLQISQMISHSNLIVLIVVFSFPFIQGVLLVKAYYAVDYVNNYFIGRALSAPDTRNFAEFKFLHRIKTTNVKRFKWPNHDDIDCVHSSCKFYGPLNLRGHAPFEIVDIK
ncbi:unnamed protein product [Pocillopora meandrina]|uniref:Uncharacterized protein n=1 Tax=Pocillopora meandrina TaxID=46732 RepID=A0AAU9VPW0_9CNID|nr:unnamed protein product [Pocillopora meandrina]